MDESLLERRLSRIERRLSLILLLLVFPYAVGFLYILGERDGVLLFGFSGTVLAIVAFVFLTISRRRDRGVEDHE